MSMLDDRLSNMVLTGQMTLDEALEESDDPSDLLRLCRLKRSAQYALRGYVALEYVKREIISKEALESSYRQNEDYVHCLIEVQIGKYVEYGQFQREISRAQENPDQAESELEYARAQMKALLLTPEEADAASREYYRKNIKYVDERLEELITELVDTEASLESVTAEIARLRDSARNNAVAAIFSGFGEILQYVADTLLS